MSTLLEKRPCRALVLTFAIGLWLAHGLSWVWERELQRSQFAWSSVWCYAACSHAFETQANVKALLPMDLFFPKSCKVLINESWGFPRLAGRLQFFTRLGCKHPHSLFSRTVDTQSVQHNSSTGNQYTRIYSHRFQWEAWDSGMVLFLWISCTLHIPYLLRGQRI